MKRRLGAIGGAMAGFQAPIRPRGYFGGYLGANWRAVAAGVDLSHEQLVTLARNSFTGSPDTRRD
jgi:capsid protein